MGDIRVTAETAMVEWGFYPELYVSTVTGFIEYEEILPTEYHVSAMVLMVEYTPAEPGAAPHGPKAWQA